MDEIVKQAMAKWPDVPRCTGWLALDARGNWRMRDERAQMQNLAGDKIVHPALLGFINRNYGHDQGGCWYFQNGPQRVYVDLEATPYIARTDPAQGFVDHTGQQLAELDAVWMTEKGQMLLQTPGKVALVDDRDVAHCILAVQIDGVTVNDDVLMAWLTDPNQTTALIFHHLGKCLPIQRIMSDNLAGYFGFVQKPDIS